MASKPVGVSVLYLYLSPSEQRVRPEPLFDKEAEQDVMLKCDFTFFALY